MKAVKWDDIKNPLIVERKVEGYREHVSTYTGQVPVTFICPFCREVVHTYLWSLHGSGKRCPCGALFGSSRTAYQWKAWADHDDARRH